MFGDLIEQNFIIYIQHHYLGSVEPIMIFFTSLGLPSIYIYTIAFFYWSVDEKLGARYGLFMYISGAINHALKYIFHLPRPFWVNTAIKPIDGAPTGFGFPSGHAQSSWAVMYIAQIFKARWALALSLTLMIGIGVSRVFLGVHFPNQVLVGWCVGAAIYLTMIYYEKQFLNWFQKFSTLKKMLFVSTVCMLIQSILLAIYFVYHRNPLSPEWINIVQPYLKKGETFQPYDMGHTLRIGFGLLGIMLGLTLTQIRGGFSTHGTIVTRALRFIIGGGIIMGILALNKLINFGGNHHFTAQLFNASISFLTLFAIYFIIPEFFKRMKLAGTEPQT